MSERDRASIRERREFEREFNEKQRLADDELEYRKYLSGIEFENRNQPPAYQIPPLDFATWRGFMPQDESDPALRGAQATYCSTLTRVSQVEHEAKEVANEQARQAVAAGKRDPLWILPESAKGLRMSLEKAKLFAQEQADLFVGQEKSWFKCRKNFETITGFLIEQGCLIPNVDCFKLAFERLTALGLLEQRPVEASAPEPQSQSEPPQAAVTETQDELLGWDLATGEPRRYSQFEVSKMSSDEYRRAFHVVPKFTRSFYA
jgi:hypothetical protein